MLRIFAAIGMTLMLGGRDTRVGCRAGGQCALRRAARRKPIGERLRSVRVRAAPFGE